MLSFLLHKSIRQTSGMWLVGHFYSLATRISLVIVARKTATSIIEHLLDNLLRTNPLVYSCLARIAKQAPNKIVLELGQQFLYVIF